MNLQLVTHLPDLVRFYGIRRLAYRGSYEVIRNTPLGRRLFPVTDDPGRALARELEIPRDELETHLAEKWRGNPRRALDEGCLDRVNHYQRKNSREEGIRSDAQAVTSGEIPVFGDVWIDAGNPPAWHRGEDGTEWPADRHWTDIEDLGSSHGDIKYVWNKSRFPQVYPLARACALDREDPLAETFWRHFEDWVSENRPEQGPNWMCCQEVGLRAISWTFALDAFHESSATTPNRLGELVVQLWYHCKHIEKLHWYAKRYQNNNHGLSEAAALATVGALFPFLPEAEDWRRTGIRSLVSQLDRQVFPDGSYVQYSMNYQRMVLDLLTWVVTVFENNSLSVPPDLYSKGRSLAGFLHAFQDRKSGRLPRYGSDDGTHLFPLSGSPYQDFRPTITAFTSLVEGSTPYESGPWREKAIWFGADGETASPGDTPAGFGRRFAFDSGGYYRLESERTHALVRSGPYRERPSQADLLHLDVWFDGTNVLIDPGTYQYNTEDCWISYFRGTRSHNTVTIDGADQMERGPRFLWFDWPDAETLRFERTEERTLFVGEHHGFDPAVHRREVELADDVYTVTDVVTGADPDDRIGVHWLVNDLEIQTRPEGARVQLEDPDDDLLLQVESSNPAQRSWERAAEDPPRGWTSPRYTTLEPAHSYLVEAPGPRIEFRTTIGPADQVDEKNTG